MIRATVGASTHVGQVRQGNEDSFLAIEGLYVVADGMGGHSAGEVASAIAVKTLEEIYRSTSPGMNSPERVAEAIATANTAIFLESLDDTAKAGMGTTLTALVVTDPSAHTAVIANIGDSRTYLWRDGEFRQVTVDHSHVQTLVERGAISAAEARTHYQRNIVLRALGIDSSIDIDLFPVEIRNGDRFVLCSDGLVDEADDSEIANEIRLQSDPQVLAETLVNLANAHGGRDNVTVLVVDFRVVPVEDSSSPVAFESTPAPAGSQQESGNESRSRTPVSVSRRKMILALSGALVAVSALIVTLVLAL